MKRQLELRREETKTLHLRCDSLEGKLKDLRESFRNISASKTKTESDMDEMAQDKKVPLRSNIFVCGFISSRRETFPTLRKRTCSDGPKD
ncbi:hypothetical protein M378DRAFT_155338 [Amanita muscaria Koide BX008]|uniref:Uncharacterized protein n=1 Tax=Amanita muscaria (strain Koide BX008) TaxID=946122 RepID=A0A0C2T6Y2_AMAMK|nr:hypothetical protein M378DRAFT_155338 [Amanita muscaria Koide BX008]